MKNDQTDNNEYAPPWGGNTEVDMSNIFSFGQIIQIPVDAVIEANTKASVAALNFIRTFGFETPTTPVDGPRNLYNVGKPRMLTFFYRYNNGGVEQRMVINIPVLSLVTIPLLNVNKAKFDIGINVLNHIKVSKKDSKGLIPLSSSSTLALLGPVVSKGLKDTTDNGGSYSYSTRVKTNMQASLEIESQDLPSGIMQMINLFQDATSGKGTDLVKLEVNKTSIFFSPADQTITLTVTVTKNKKPLEGETISVLVTSETDPNIANTFSKPIEVVTGNVIGIPNITEAVALSNAHGKVRFTFTSAMKVLNSENNGFIYFKNSQAKKIATYYRLI